MGTMDLARGRLPGRSQGRQSTPPGTTCLDLHLDGLCGAVVSTDAHATHLLYCLCASEQRVSGEASADPALAPEAGRAASGGREPAQHDPRGRLEAAPRGSSAAEQAGTARSVAVVLVASESARSLCPATSSARSWAVSLRTAMALASTSALAADSARSCETREPRVC